MLACMDDDTPVSGPLDKVWAAFGLVAGIALVWMAVDLLRPRREETSDDAQPG
jgi:hypothetical protein